MQKDIASLTSTTAETPQEFLERIFCEIPHIDGMFVQAADGEIIANVGTDGVGENLPALLNELAQLATRAAAASGQGSPQYQLLKNQNGYLIVVALSGVRVFAMMGCEHIRPDVIQYSVEWIASQLTALL